MVLLLGAILALVPLLITPGLLFYFDVSPKVFVLLAGTAVLLPWIARRGRLRSLWSFREGRWLALLLLAALVSFAISTALSAHRGLSFGGTNWRRLGLVSYSAITLFTGIAAAYLSAQKIDVLLTLLRITSASGLVNALYGTLQYFGWDPFLPAAAYHIGGGAWTIVRPPGTVGYASYFATYLLAVVFCGAGLALADRARVWRFLGAAAAGFAGVAIILSGTRAAMLGLVAGAVLMLVWLRPRVRAIPAAAGAAVLTAGALWFYFSSPGAQLRSRVRWFEEDPAGGSRVLLWRDSLRMAAGRPVFGYGPETFSAEFPKFQSAELARAYPDFYQESPHNVFIDALAGQGVPGLAVLALLCALGFYAGTRARKDEGKLAGALSAALAAILVSQFFTSFVIVTALYTFVLVGMLVALRSPSALCTGEAACSTLAMSITIPVAVLLLTFALRLLVADRALAAADHSLMASDAARAIESYNQARRWLPAGAGSDIWYSRRMALFAENSRAPVWKMRAWKEARGAAERATETADDRQNAWYNLAAFYAAQNDIPRTAASLRAAIEAAPNWFKPHWLLAQVLRVAGQAQEAEREARRATELNGGKNPEVALTLRQIQAGK